MANPVNFRPTSLNQILGRERTELAEVSAVLTYVNSSDIHTIEDLARKILELNLSPEEIEKSRQLWKKFATKQFFNPITEAIREAITNAKDSQEKAKITTPIQVHIKEKCFKSTDAGIGLCWENLGHLLVGGSSSNPLAFVSQGKDIPHVAGRFGQGFISLFYFLYSSENIKNLPLFQKTDHQTTLIIPYFLNGKRYAAAFCLAKGQDLVKLSIYQNEEQRKISIDTTSNNQRMKLKFSELNDKIYIDIFKKDVPAPSSGFDLKIVAPLIETHADAIKQSVRDFFGHVLSPAILVNGERINHTQIENTILPPPDSQSKPLTEIKFDWGSLSFSPPSASRECSLWFCEGGRMICKFCVKSSFVVEKIVVNFNSLNLTHDRSSIGFQDPELLKGIHQALLTILKTTDLSLQQKSTILNSLYVIIKEDKCNLIQPFMTMLQQSSYQILPDLPEFEKINLENTLYLNPKYIKTIKLPVFYESGNFVYHWLNANLSVPASFCKIGPNHHYFLDSRLKFPNSDAYTKFNLTLFNHWIVQLGLFGKLPLEQIFTGDKTEKTFDDKTNVLTHQTNNQPGTFLIDLTACGIDLSDLSSQELMCKTAMFIELEKSTSSLQYPPEIRKEVVSILTNFTSPDFASAPLLRLKFLYHVLCQNEDLRFIFNQKKSGNFVTSLINYRIEHINKLMIQIKTFLIHQPEEADLYKIFISENASYYEMQNDQFFVTVFWKWKRFLEAAGWTDYDREMQVHASEIEDEHIHLMSLIQTLDLDISKNLLCLFITKLKDVSYLIDLPPQNLTIIISVCFELDLDKCCLSTYKNINGLISRLRNININDFHDLMDLSKLVALFLSNDINDLIHPLKINTSSLLEFLEKTYEEENEEDSKDIISSVSNALQDVKLLSIKVHRFNNVSINIEKVCEELNIKEHKSNISIFIEKLNPYIIRNAIKQNEIEYALDLYEARKLYAANPTPNNLKVFRDTFVTATEKLGFVRQSSWDFILAALSLGDAEFFSRDYRFPEVILSPPIPLHKDPVVLGKIKKEKLAADRIQSALKQTNKRFSCLAELIKNAKEAIKARQADTTNNDEESKAQIDIEIHTDKEGQNLFLVITDPVGMKPDEIIAIKNPWETTKRKEADDDPNFGWGFFSSFHDFPSVYVTTSPDGMKHTDMLFVKQGNFLSIQEASWNSQGAKGTKLILKKATKRAEQEFHYLRSMIYNLCRYEKEIIITFQGVRINGSPLNIDDRTHIENYCVNGINKGCIQFQLSQTENGLFWKDMRIDKNPEVVYSLVPLNMRKAVFGEKGLCIFLPEAEQNMNRNQIINSNRLIPILQRGALALAIQHYLNECLLNGTLKEISNDFWDDFRVSYDITDPFFLRFVDALQDQNWNQALDDRTDLEEKLLLEAAKHYFTNLTKANVLYFPKNQTIEEHINAIQQLAISHHLDSLNDKIRELLSNPRNLALVLISVPLIKDGPSLGWIRDALIFELDAQDLLRKGKFSDKLLGLDIQQASNAIDGCIERVEEVCQLDSSYDIILSHFKNAILNHVKEVKRQEDVQLIGVDSSLASLKAFIEATASEILKRSIEIVYYDEADNRHAYTTRGSKIIYLNKKSPILLFLCKWLESRGRYNSPSFDMKKQEVEHLVQLLETLCHELTHQDEETDCDTTHDETFRIFLSKFLERLFIRPQDQKNSLELFRRIIN